MIHQELSQPIFAAHILEGHPGGRGNQHMAACPVIVVATRGASSLVIDIWRELWCRYLRRLATPAIVIALEPSSINGYSRRVPKSFMRAHDITLFSVSAQCSVGALDGISETPCQNALGENCLYSNVINRHFIRKTHHQANRLQRIGR